MEPLLCWDYSILGVWLQAKPTGMGVSGQLVLLFVQQITSQCPIDRGHKNCLYTDQQLEPTLFASGFKVFMNALVSKVIMVVVHFNAFVFPLGARVLLLLVVLGLLWWLQMICFIAPNSPAIS